MRAKWGAERKAPTFRFMAGVTSSSPRAAGQVGWGLREGGVEKCLRGGFSPRSTLPPPHALLSLPLPPPGVALGAKATQAGKVRQVRNNARPVLRPSFFLFIFLFFFYFFFS